MEFCFVHRARSDSYARCPRKPGGYQAGAVSRIDKINSEALTVSSVYGTDGDEFERSDASTRPRMRRFVDFEQAGAVDRGITLRRRQAGVAQ
jgi:hypothetical protein